MSSEEDFNARSFLQDMQAKLAESPHAALGVPPHATPSDIRSAFLELTKKFHPARFGRRAVDIQRLSNEVFLSLRAAHELLVKAKPSGRSGSTTAVPPLRPSTRPFGVPVTPATRPGVSSQLPRTPASPNDRPTGGQAPIQPSSGTTPPPARANPAPNAGRSQPIPVVRTTTTPSQQPPQGPPAQHPGSRPPPTGVKFNAPGTPTRSTGPNPPVRAAASSSTLQVIEPALAPFLEQLGRGQWDQAQAAIDALVAKNPQNKRYAAFAAYARGRRAQVEGNARIAQIELNDALVLDPTNELAKSAVAELYARKK